MVIKKRVEKEKTISVSLIVILVILGIIAIVFFIRLFSPEDNWICQNGSWIKHGNPSDEMPSANCGEENPIIGGDKDEHGCLIAAGYSWNESKQKCVREWEEKLKTYCDENSRLGDACTMEYAPVCGYYDSSIQCVTSPCAQTYGNDCVACHNTEVEYYIVGECENST